MAEAAGLAIGVVALAGLFNNTVECFEYIQLGRAFEKDFKTAQLQLDSCELRISRWGSSLGLNRITLPADISIDVFGSQSDVNHAKRLLTQILELFAEAEGVSAKFKSRVDSGSNELAICDPQSRLDSSLLNLHNQMRTLAIDRQNKAGFKRRAKWALYEEKRFRRLIEDITELVGNLEGLFPAGGMVQQQLCEAEVAVLGKSEEVNLLKTIAAQQDKLLEAALKTGDGGSTTQRVEFSGDHNEGFQLGFNSGTISNTFGKSGQ
jgi:hypothetical protein